MFDSIVISNPSFIEPQLLTQVSQRSGAFELLPKGDVRTRLSTEDKYVYIKTLQMRAANESGQAAANQLSSPTFVTKLISTATYLVRARAQYDHHDTAAAGMWDVPLPEAYRRATWQTFAQNARDALLYGFSPSAGEGLLNTVGLTSVNLPADSNGATTFRTYDNGQMALFMLQQMVATQIRLFQGAQGGNKIVVIGPQRILSYMIKANVVQLVQFQRPGAGTAATGQMIQEQFQSVGDRVTWAFDDTLIGKGAGGTDAVLIVIPELDDQEDWTGPNTNAFQGLTPSLNECTLQYADMVAPREITTPVAGGVTDVLYERRITSGWGVRPEAITLINMAY